MPLLSVRNVTLKFGGITAVRSVSLAVEKGSIFSIIGPNGAGKTTLFNAISGVYPPTEGDIAINDSGIAEKLTGRTYAMAVAVGLLSSIILSLFCSIQGIWEAAISNTYVYEEPFDWAAAAANGVAFITQQSVLLTIGLPLLGGLAAAAGFLSMRKRSLITPEAVVRRGVARTFQNIRLFPSMSARQVVLCGLQLHRRATTKVLRDEADQLLEFVGLKGFEDRGSTTLAYGNQRRLEIARALATQPSLLLLDEPAAGMNETESETLVALIRKVRDTGVTVLLIEHHMSVVMTVSDRVLVMQNGAVLAEGTPQEIQSNTKVIAAYLGEDLL